MLFLYHTSIFLYIWTNFHSSLLPYWDYCCFSFYFCSPAPTWAGQGRGEWWGGRGGPRWLWPSRRARSVRCYGDPDKYLSILLFLLTFVANILDVIRLFRPEKNAMGFWMHIMVYSEKYRDFTTQAGDIQGNQSPLASYFLSLRRTFDHWTETSVSLPPQPSL